MKRYLLLLSFILVFVLPNFIIHVMHDDRSNDDIPSFSLIEQTDMQDKLLIEDHGTVIEMDLEEYILGVVLGEMPTDFEIEALKAQAVATRTYTLRSAERGSKHLYVHLCTDASCCQAYSDSGNYPESVVEKFRLAVAETSGQVLIYEDELIEATYFSCSGGLTEDAVAVWGADVPYLKSVDSPGEENADYYETEYQYSTQEFLNKLKLPENLQLTDKSFVITYTQGDGVARMYIANTCFTGIQLRSLLDLPSTAFTVHVEDDVIHISAKGYGHRVGMSQYGADAMAVSGKGYEEILLHYYPGTTLIQLGHEELKGIFDKAGKL